MFTIITIFVDVFDSYNIDSHDYSVRLKAARKFLQDGDKVGWNFLIISIYIIIHTTAYSIYFNFDFTALIFSSIPVGQDYSELEGP